MWAQTAYANDMSLLHRRGFTLIELIIVIVIMAALLGLGVAAVDGLQAQARDKERSTDISIIARGLERRYQNGTTLVTAPEGQAGSYPSAAEMQALVTASTATQVLTGTGRVNFSPPGNGGQFIVLCGSGSCATSIAEGTQQATAMGSGDNYVYEPVNTNGKVCVSASANGPCVRFNLYWKSESQGGSIQTVRSKHQ